ncbi:HAD-IIB family hydrolase [Neptuniibacter halophilus]|uniref:HAD-IIB family hydrolase n=1 Tax=Neptuniibacter halophilus TaxID=651666 RepID=UPI002574189E|nr:HAD-IIB family hydrolase [Neptuniibacter halophilus]
MSERLLIYTDLDGSLLDHYSYGFAPAAELLGRLAEHSVPVIPVTSKTRAELIPLRVALSNPHPFVVENGAAVFIPEYYFPEPVSGCEVYGDFLCQRFSEPRGVWQQLLIELKPLFTNEFISFSEAGVSGIIEMTGLSPASAALANQRDFSEPVYWLGSENRKQQFIRAAQRHGANVLEGGRFLHITGQCDKGKALNWLSERYRQFNPGNHFTTLAAGDSQNDLAMLSAADLAVLIRSPVHPPPVLEHPRLNITEAMGPDGWNEAVSRLAAPFLRFSDSDYPQGKE